MKNRDILLDAIGDIDDELIPDLLPIKQSSFKKKAVIGIGICAAAVACAIILPKVNNVSKELSQADQSQTDRIVITGTEKIASEMQFDGNGIGALMAYDISELETPNPWNPDLELSSLPVYRYLSEADIRIGAVYLTEEQAIEIAQKAASALNADISQTDTTYVKDFVGGGIPDEIMDKVYSVEAKCSDGTNIKVYGDGKTKIKFKNSALPSEYNFSHSNTSPEQAEQILEYLYAEFSELLGYDDAVLYSYAERSYSGNQERKYYMFNRTDDTIQNILNYNLSYAQFAPDDNGKLMLIWIFDYLKCSEYSGDYPVITQSEAKDMLLNGSYYSSVDKSYLYNGTITESNIAKAELVYRRSGDGYAHSYYYQPYYLFYVELDASKFNTADELKNYGLFYVPAVESRYLVDSDE